MASVLSSPPGGPHGIGTGIESARDFRERFGRILEIGINGQNGVTTHIRQSHCDSTMLSNTVGQVDNAKGKLFGAKSEQHLQGVICATVEDYQQFARTLCANERASHPRYQCSEIIFLV